MFPVSKAPRLPDSTQDEACWVTVSRWLDRCASEHALCKESSGWLPTRLVDVCDFGDGCIRIVDSSTIAKCSQKSYLALSHCWGAEDFLTMKETNREDFERGMLISCLPPNFQDAIHVTRRLGFRFLWIDSLCIVQRCPYDWDKEAPLMNKVYRNAFLTLGAMSSPNAYGGLFRARDARRLGPSPFRLNLEGEGVVDCLVARSDLWEAEVRRAPLNQRAWVVQERVLAPRSLYFAQSQLFWECRELYACETFPDGVPIALVSDVHEPDSSGGVVSVKAFRRTARALRGRSVAELRESFGGPRGEFRQHESSYQVWNEILDMYARCGLTDPRDKLVAISGVVKDFADAVGDEYLAGLWRKNLVNGLLWQVWGLDECLSWNEEYCRDPARRPLEYRAPTWSWASVDASMTRAHPLEVEFSGEYAEVLDVHIEPEGSDPTGRLRHACLRVSGRLIKTRRTPRKAQLSGLQFGRFLPDVDETLDGDGYLCLPLRRDTPAGEGGGEGGGGGGSGDAKLLGLVLKSWTAGAELPSGLRRCSECAGESVATRVGVFEMGEGEPVRYLGMSKPQDWEDWGDESDHVWFPDDAPFYEFSIL